MSATVPEPCPAGPAETHVVIAPELRALYRARRGTGRASRPDAAAQHGGSPRPLPATTGDAAAQGWRRVRLRRDGARPFVFDGAPLLRRRLDVPLGPDGGRASHVFALYLARCGGLVAHLAFLVGEGIPARPVHTVRTVDGPGSAAALLDDHDPARGLVALSGPASAADPDLARRLRADARFLARAALRAAPLAAQTVNGA